MISVYRSTVLPFSLGEKRKLRAARGSGITATRCYHARMPHGPSWAHIVIALRCGPFSNLNKFSSWGSSFAAAPRAAAGLPLRGSAGPDNVWQYCYGPLVSRAQEKGDHNMGAARRAQHLLYVREANERTTGWITLGGRRRFAPPRS